MELISTKYLVRDIESKINEEAANLAVIIKTNASPDEVSYLKNIIKNASYYNISVFKFYADTDQQLLDVIENIYANHEQFAGMIVISSYSELQSAYLDKLAVLDIDCQSRKNLSSLFFSSTYYAPCTANAVYQIVTDRYGSDLSGKNVAIINRSLVVGRPAAVLLMKNNATVTIFHSKSKIESLEDYDIIITATGQPNTVHLNQFSSDTSKEHFIIDVGVRYDKDKGKLCGDVDLESFEDFPNFKIVASPGGVGPLSTAILLSRCKL